MDRDRVKAGMRVLDDLKSFFTGLQEQHRPYQKMFAQLILRAARDWFQGREEDPESCDPKIRARADYSREAYLWFMSDENFIGVYNTTTRPRGTITFVAACSGLGLSPSRFRDILHIDTAEEFESYREREHWSSRGGDSSYP